MILFLFLILFLSESTWVVKPQPEYSSKTLIDMMGPDMGNLFSDLKNPRLSDSG